MYVAVYNDYYPFGMLVPNRHASSAAYRYGFNGMEKDDEIKGSEGNSYDYGKRFYDPRVGRFLSLDPLAMDFPYESNYNFVSNNPIIYNDPTGGAKILKMVITDRETGITKTVFVVLDQWEIASKKANYIDKQSGDFVNSNSWHDINVTQNMIREPDGSFTMVGEPVTSVGEYVLTNSLTWFRAQLNITASRIDAGLPGTDDGLFLMGDGEDWEGGGVMFTSKKGRFGAGVRGTNKKRIDVMDADALFEFIEVGSGVAKGGSNKTPGSNNPSTTTPGGWKTGVTIPELDAIFDATKDVHDKLKTGEGAVKRIDNIAKKVRKEIWKMNNYQRTMELEPIPTMPDGNKIDGGAGGNQGAGGYEKTPRGPVGKN